MKTKTAMVREAAKVLGVPTTNVRVARCAPRDILGVPTPTPQAPLFIGPYRVQYLSPTVVSLFDTRTNEGGAFSADALTETLVSALDTFFADEF